MVVTVANDSCASDEGFGGEEGEKGEALIDPG